MNDGVATDNPAASAPSHPQPVLSIFFFPLPSARFGSEPPVDPLPGSFTGNEQSPQHAHHPRGVPTGILFFMMGPMGTSGSSMQGQPPASKGATEKLVSYTANHLPAHILHDVECAICQDALFTADNADTMGADIRILEMPCRHYFHNLCLLPWLRTSNTCPNCRYPLDTDNAEYNSTVVARERNRFLPKRPQCIMVERSLCASSTKGNIGNLASLSCGCHVCVECIVVNTSRTLQGSSLTETISTTPLSQEVLCPGCQYSVHLLSPALPSTTVSSLPPLPLPSPFLLASHGRMPGTPIYSPPPLSSLSVTSSPHTITTPFSPIHPTSGLNASTTFTFYDMVDARLRPPALTTIPNNEQDIFENHGWLSNLDLD